MYIFSMVANIGMEKSKSMGDNSMEISNSRNASNSTPLKKEISTPLKNSTPLKKVHR
jgi:hypothetical protein